MKVIQVKNLSVHYNGSAVLDRVNFHIEEGEIVAVLGPNGSGKTTLLRALLGLIPITQGTVEILGSDISHVLKELAYVPQRFSFDKYFPMTVREYLDLYLPSAMINKDEIIQERLSHVGIFSTMHQTLGELSGGQLQRLLIARSTLNNPKILFLDEPVAGVDTAGEKTFYEIIQHLNQAHKTTIVIVSHEIDFVYQYATHVLCLKNQMIHFGKPETILRQENLKALYSPMVIHHHHNPKK